MSKNNITFKKRKKKYSTKPLTVKEAIKGGMSPLEFIKEGISRTYNALKGTREGAPPDIRKMLSEFGNNTIVRISIVREPIKSIIDKAINLISLGQWNKTKKQYNYDSLFHLYCFLTLDNGKIIRLERNQVVQVTYVSKIPQIHDEMQFTPNKKTTLGDFVNNAANKVGPSFWVYNAKSSNCQKFITDLLRYSGLLTDKLDKFINQETEKVVESLPAFTQNVMNGLTNIANRADIILHGKKLGKKHGGKKRQLRGGSDLEARLAGYVLVSAFFGLKLAELVKNKR